MKRQRRASGLSLDLDARTASRDGSRLALTPKEFDVLAELVKAASAPVSRAELLERLWEGDPGEDVLKAVIHRLRRKLGDPPAIHAISGQGYWIQP